MAFYNKEQREDMQENTFTIISEYVYLASRALVTLNALELLRYLDVIYIITNSRLSQKEKQDIEDKLGEVRQLLHGPERLTARTGIQLSRALTLEREIFKELCAILDKKHILFRINIQASDIGAGTI